MEYQVKIFRRKNPYPSRQEKEKRNESEQSLLNSELENAKSIIVEWIDQIQHVVQREENEQLIQESTDANQKEIPLLKEENYLLIDQLEEDADKEKYNNNSFLDQNQTIEEKQIQNQRDQYQNQQLNQLVTITQFNQLDDVDEISRLDQIYQTNQLQSEQRILLQDVQCDTIIKYPNDVIEMKLQSNKLIIEDQPLLFPSQKEMKKQTPQAKAKMKIENRLLKPARIPFINIDPGPPTQQQQLKKKDAQPDLPQYHQVPLTQLKLLLIKKELIMNLSNKYELIKKQNSLIAQDIYQLKIRRYYINKLGTLNQSQILRRVRLKKEKKKDIKDKSNQLTIIMKHEMEDQLFSEIRNILQKLTKDSQI